MPRGPGLTDADIGKSIKKAKADGRTIIARDTGKTPGLQLVVTANGTATWSWLYTPKGEIKPRRIKLGRHAPGFGLVQARLAVGALREKVSKGIDPATERETAALEQRRALEAARAEATAEKQRITVTKLSELYFAARHGDAGMDRVRGIIEFSVLPVIGTNAVETLKKPDLQHVVDTVRTRGNATQCHRVLEALRPMLKWAIDREYLPADRDGMWRKLSLPKKGGARDRVLSASEIKWLWERTAEWDSNLARIVRLDLLLGQRSSETCEIARPELSADLRTWTLPGLKTKNGKPHVVPLPPLARTIVAEALAAVPADQAQLFEGARGAVARADDVAHAIADAIKAWNEAHPADAVAHFTPHDLRRTLASRLEETGTAMTVIATALNHISGKSGSVTRKHYAHGDTSLAVRHALAKWQGLVEQCLSGLDPFELRVEDADAVEARALAEARGGKPRLDLVWKETK